MAVAFSVAREAAIREHKKHLGKNETPGGSNRTYFGRKFGLDPAPYCAMAIVVTNEDAGSSAATVRSASSSAIQRGGVATGRSVSTPQRGDLIHVYKNGRSVHIERVLSYSGGKLICIGSNTSNTSGGSTADGGGTYINDRTAWWRNRNSNSGWSIKGITRPFYGVTTEDVRTVQTAARIKVDGKIGPATVDAVRVLQRQHGLTVDGFPGPATLAAITDKPAAKPAPSTSKAPAFPLPRKAPNDLFYYGPRDGGRTSVSGMGRNRWVGDDVYQDKNGRWHSRGLAKFQARLIERGWGELKKDGPDGRFGDTMHKVVGQFQKAMGLTVDHKIGPSTWAAAWTEPVK